MAKLNLKELIEVGLHFGHAAASWNPKMKPYLFGIRKKVHIFDLKQTIRSLVAASHLVNQCASQGKKFLFVGTKVQAQDAIVDVAKATNSYYVSERWLGGMLTNHGVIMKRLHRMNELEEILAEDHSIYSKKVLSSFKRDLKKLKRDLNGVRGMERLPDVVVIIDPGHEHIAVKEANICGIPIIALTDSNCDPEPIDLVIPGNDDALKAINLVLNQLQESILAGAKDYEEVRAREEAEAQAAAAPGVIDDGSEEGPAESTGEEAAAPAEEAAAVAAEENSDNAVTPSEA